MLPCQLLWLGKPIPPRMLVFVISMQGRCELTIHTYIHTYIHPRHAGLLLLRSIEETHTPQSCMEKVRYIRSSHYWIHYKLSAQPLPRGGPDQWAGDVYCDHLECWSLSFRLDMMPGRYELTYIAPCGFVVSLTSIEETHTPQSCMEKAIEGERRRSSIQVVRTSPPPGDPISGLGMSNPYIHTFHHAGLLLLRSIEETLHKAVWRKSDNRKRGVASADHLAAGFITSCPHIPSPGADPISGLGTCIAYRRKIGQ